MFGVPYRNYSNIDSTSSEHFGIYQVDGLKIESKHTISSENSNWGNIGRGLIFDIHAITYGALVKGSNMTCEEIK